MTEDESKAFVELVERMRQAQKDYFTHRATETLHLSKELEGQVDRFIEKQNQPGLF